MRNARYIEAMVDVRLWGTSTANVKNGSDVSMPFHKGNAWRPVIELSTGKIEGCPEHTTAAIQFPIFDSGDYWLLNENKERIAKWTALFGPAPLLGSSISLISSEFTTINIKQDGTVEHWRAPNLNAGQWETFLQPPIQGVVKKTA